MAQEFHSYRQLLDYGIGELTAHQVPDASLDADYLMEYVTGMRHIDFVLNQNQQPKEDEIEKYLDVIATRSQRIPLQHITGVQNFMGYDFKVNEDVLCPRQDTETLVELALDKLKPGMEILDMCTGSGCIVISVTKFAKEKLHINGLKGTGVDYSPKALAVARENAVALNPEIQLIESDLFTRVEGEYDMILSNPPYIPSRDCDQLMPEVIDHEPRMALDGDEDGLKFYRKITEESVQYLKQGGWLIYEIGYDQGESVSQLMLQAGYQEVQVRKDLAGHDRVVMGHL